MKCLTAENGTGEGNGLNPNPAMGHARIYLAASELLIAIRFFTFDECLLFMKS